MTESEAIKELHGIRPRGGIIPQKRAEALDVAIQALEEVEQYRAIGTPEECLRNKDFLRFLANSMNQKKYETYLRIYNAVEKDGRDEE
jgi:hypothetical protein